MTRTLGRVVLSLACAGQLVATTARAQDASGSAEVDLEVGAGVEAETALETTVAAPVAPVVVTPSQPAVERPLEVDGMRFRGAIAASGGAEFASGFEIGMAGVEGRIGLQINNLIGIYVQPSLSFGAGSVANIPVFTGTAGVSALIDFTIANHFFVGVGGGFGILNNPVGPELHFRIGGYPVVGIGEDGYSRQGLVMGVDARMFFLSAAGIDLIVGQILGSIGYEVF